MKHDNQHTPGPWIIAKPKIPKGQLVMSGSHIVAKCEERGIDCYSSGFAQAQVEANARLIATAPDLLAALQDVMRSFPDNGERGDVAPWSLDAARAAIRKATEG